MPTTIETIAAQRRSDPKRLRQMFRGELDWIVMKALEKDRNRRYESASGFAADVRRYLADEPVLACPPSAGYRLRKLVSRNRGKVTAAALVLLSLAAGVAISTWQAVSANRARDRAELAEGEVTAQLAKVSAAEHKATENLEQARRALWQAKLAQAQAGRWSGRAGRVFDSLQALAEAARIGRSIDVPRDGILELRNEAIACFALTDLRANKDLERYTPDNPGAALDVRSQRYTRSDSRGNITVCRIADGQAIARLKGPAVGVSSVAFSPDGRFLEASYPDAVAGERRRILIWDLRRPYSAFQLAPQFSHPAIVWSPDGRRFALHGRAGTITLYDAVSREALRTIPTGAPPNTSHPLSAWDHEIAFHPNGKQLAVLATGAVQIRDVETGNLVGQFAFPIPVLRFTWGAGGRFLAGACADDDVVKPPAKTRHIYVWDVPAGRMHKVLEGHGNVVIDLAFNHAGDLLASTAWDGTVRLWDPWTGKELVSAQVGWGRPLEFSSDDRFLSVPDGWSRARGWWEVKSVRGYRTLHGPTENRDGMVHVDFSPDGRWMASAASDGFWLWDVPAGAHIAMMPPTVIDWWRLEPNGEALLTHARAGFYRWPLSLIDEGDAGRKLRIGPPEKLAGGDLGHLGVEHANQDERLMLAFDDGHRVVAVDLRERCTGRVVLPGIDGLDSPRLSPDRKWLATGTWHGDGAKVWDFDTGKLVRRLTTQDAQACFSPDGNGW